MNTRLTLLTASCALALMACSNKAPAPEPAAAAPATTEAAPAAPAASETPAAASTPAASSNGKPAAVVANCSTEIEGNDAMQFNVGSIVVPASCSDFTINLKHVGKMPVGAMGHNVVITTSADLQSVATAGMGAGLAADHVKAGDARVIAHTKLIGGGETTSVSFPVSKITAAGPYSFFCSFPGHSSMMKGTISVE